MKDHDDCNPIDLEEFAKSGKEIPTECSVFRIRIDDDKYLVQKAALTGRELLLLAEKDPDCSRVFFLKCCGTKIEIALDEHISLLKSGVERFKTGAESEIIVNGRSRSVSEPEITFAAVVALAFGDTPSAVNTIFTVTYKNGPTVNPQGPMVRGDTVKVKCGMIFNVTPTDKS